MFCTVGAPRQALCSPPLPHLCRLLKGTTSFDALIAAVDSKAFVAAARRAGYTSLTMQVGRGVRLPTTLLPDGATEACEDGFTVRYFRFAPDLSAYVRGAGLVVRRVLPPARAQPRSRSLAQPRGRGQHL